MSPSADRRAIAGYAMIGFALGGFFDGILLHQILQWHHLLSAIDGPAAGDLRFQMVADGVFHLAMYVIALIGAGLLVAARRARSPGLSLRRMAALVLAGFGSWHCVDALLVHWALGLHHIRMDAANPILWDIGWLAVFGGLPLAAAWLLRQPGGEPPPRRAVAALLVATAVAGLAAAAGPRVEGGGDTVVIFRAGTEPAAMLEAIGAADTRLKGTAAGGTLWIVEPVSWSGLATLYRRGALIVGSTPVFGGCLAATKA